MNPHRPLQAGTHHKRFPSQPSKTQAGRTHTLWRGHCQRLLLHSSSQSIPSHLHLCTVQLSSLRMPSMRPSRYRHSQPRRLCRLCLQRHWRAQLGIRCMQLLGLHPSPQIQHHTQDMTSILAPYVSLVGTSDLHGTYIVVQHHTQLGLMQCLRLQRQQRTLPPPRCQLHQSQRNSRHLSRRLWLDLSPHHGSLPGIEYTRLPQEARRIR